MYNRILFNRAGYNRADIGEFIWSAEAFGQSGAAAYIIVTRRLAGSASAVAVASGDIVRIFAMQGDISAESAAAGRIIRIRSFSSEVEAISYAKATGLVSYGTEILAFSDELTLQPGDELIIDTEAMTVTLNGENAVAYVTDDSIFFKLAPGDSTLSFAGGEQADIRILWKDRWL